MLVTGRPTSRGAGYSYLGKDVVVGAPVVTVRSPSADGLHPLGARAPELGDVCSCYLVFGLNTRPEARPSFTPSPKGPTISAL